MQNAEPDYAKDPEVPKNVPIQDDSETKTKEFQAALAAEKKKRRSRPWLVALLSLLLVALGAVAAIYVYKTYFETKPTSDTQSNNQQDKQPATQSDAKKTTQLLDEAKLKLTNPTPADTADDYVLLAVQVPGFDYKTDLKDASLQKGYEGEIPAPENTIKLAEIGKIFKDNGFKEDTSTSNPPTAYEARYYGADAVCYVSSKGSYDNPSANHAATVVCSSMEDFKKTAAAQKPFYEASKSQVPFDTSGALYGMPQITDGTTAGYKTAKLMWSVANAGAGASELMFYQAPNSGWQYATRIGGLGPQPSCDEFKTDDAKKAYAGLQCYNGTTASIVK